jgi:hypothetical protein
LCTGDQLVMEKTVDGRQGYVPVVLFLRKQEEKEDVYLATPTGVLLFKCTEFYEYAQERTKNVFLENLDKMLKQKIAIASIKA